MARPEQISSSSFDTVVTDMDGSVYSFKNKSNIYKGSSLEQAVKLNLTKLIIDREKITRQEARQIIEEIEVSGKFFSIHFSQKYNISRKDFFDRVWNIDPKEHIDNFEIPKRKLQELKSQGKRIILLTSAPSMWAKRVINYLDLNLVLDEVITAESFSIKTEVFQSISTKFLPNRTLSIGDQEETDILPASNLGMITFHISHPSEFSLII